MILFVKHIKRFPYYLLLLVLSFSLCACQVRPLSVDKVEQARVLNLSQKGIELELGVKIKNPNSFAFNIYTSEFDVVLDEIPLGKANIKDKVRIPANSEELHTFVIQSDFSKLMAGGLFQLLALTQKRAVTIHLKGGIKAGNFFYKKTFFVERRETISLKSH